MLDLQWGPELVRHTGRAAHTLLLPAAAAFLSLNSRSRISAWEGAACMWESCPTLAALWEWRVSCSQACESSRLSSAGCVGGTKDKAMACMHACKQPSQEVAAQALRLHAVSCPHAAAVPGRASASFIWHSFWPDVVTHGAGGRHALSASRTAS